MNSELKSVIEDSNATETKEIILNDTVTIHTELKKLSPLERIQILNTIIKEEEAEEIIKLKKQEEINKNDDTAMSKNGCKMYLKAIMSELQSLRTQMHEIQNNVNFLHRNHQRPQCPLKKQLEMQNQMQQNLCRVDDYTSEDDCNIVSLVIDWMPIWIFFAFVLFAFTCKPRVPLSSIAESCPLSSLGEFITRM